jgi:hypothetical protein
MGRRDKYLFQENIPISDSIRNINRVLASSPVFHQAGNLEWIDGHHGAVLGALRRPDQDSDQGYLIFANLDILNSYALEVDLSTLLKTKKVLRLEDQIDGSWSEVRTDQALVNIEPCGIRIFRIGEF